MANTIIEITREKQYRSRFYQGPGPEWKWIYHLPERTETTVDGHVRRWQPGGFSTKQETLELVRRIYTERPILVQFPDGAVKEIKR
jgi:hypothetical protein